MVRPVSGWTRAPSRRTARTVRPVSSPASCTAASSADSPGSTFPAGSCQTNGPSAIRRRTSNSRPSTTMTAAATGTRSAADRLMPRPPWFDHDVVAPSWSEPPLPPQAITGRLLSSGSRRHGVRHTLAESRTRGGPGAGARPGTVPLLAAGLAAARGRQPALGAGQQPVERAAAGQPAPMVGTASNPAGGSAGPTPPTPADLPVEIDFSCSEQRTEQGRNYALRASPRLVK